MPTSTPPLSSVRLLRLWLAGWPVVNVRIIGVIWARYAPSASTKLAEPSKAETIPSVGAWSRSDIGERVKDVSRIDRVVRRGTESRFKCVAGLEEANLNFRVNVTIIGDRSAGHRSQLPITKHRL